MRAILLLAAAAMAAGARLRSIMPRASVPRLGPPRLKVGFLKQQLEARGVSTAGIVEKEELVRLYEALDAGGGSAITALPIVEMQGGAYAEFASDSCAPLRLLVDSGAATTIVAANAALRASLPTTSGGATAVLRCSRHPDVQLDCRIGTDAQFPPGVDGILGIDSLRTFEAAELDFGLRELRLHKSPWCDSGATPAAATFLPMVMKPVSAGMLPFVDATFVSGERRVRIDGLIDTGSPVTMVTPELREAVAMVPCATTQPILTTGVDGQPTRMEPCVCESVALGQAESANAAGAPLQPRQDQRSLEHPTPVSFVGLCPMMAMVGWAGQPAALVGLDLLRTCAGSSTSGLPTAGKLVFDFAQMHLIVID